MLSEINIKVMLILHGWVGGIENLALVVVIISNHLWQYFPIPITRGFAACDGYWKILPLVIGNNNHHTCEIFNTTNPTMKDYINTYSF